MPHIISRCAMSAISSFIRCPDRNRCSDTGAMREAVADAPSTTVTT